MTTITLAQIMDAVEATLATAPTLARSQSFDDLSEGINDTPLLQVYPESWTQDAVHTGTDRTTFQGKVRQTEFVVNVDYYAQQRKHIGEDMAELVAGADALIAIFEAQDKKPYFGLMGIQAFHWIAQRVTFEYGDPAIKYVGYRVTLTVRVF